MGIKLISEIKESDFKKKTSSLNELFILIRMDSLVYYVADQNERLLFFRHYEIEKKSYSKKDKNFYAQLASIIKSDDFLHLPYKKSKIGFGNELYSLLPKRLFNADDARPLLSELTNQPISEIGTDILEDLKSIAVYDFDRSIATAIQSYYPNAKMVHIATSFLLGAQRFAKANNHQAVFANINSDQLQIAVFEKENLIFYNTFRFQTTKDCLYFVLLVYEQLGLNPNEVPLYLAGQIVQDSEIFSLLYRYINELKFVKTPAGISLGNSFDKIATHFYFDLFSLHYC